MRLTELSDAPSSSSPAAIKAVEVDAIEAVAPTAAANLRKLRRETDNFPIVSPFFLVVFSFSPFLFTFSIMRSGEEIRK
jgi:hypothetical protein